METRVERLTDLKQDDGIYQEAAEILKNGGLVAFPTETVYGLGANGMDEEAAAKIYAAKGRPSDNPLILHIAERKQLLAIADEVPETAKKLMDCFWPGPLTMIFKKKKEISYGITGGLETVAVRMPNHPVALRLIRETGLPIAAPSANTSGRPSPTKAEHVWEDLCGRVDLILDGGMVGIGIESTIVDVTVDPIVILRPGYITQEMLKDVLQEEVKLDPALMSGVESDVKPKAPGMKYRHYAPNAELTIVEGDPKKAAEMIRQLTREKEKQGYRVGIIGTEECEPFYRGMLYELVGSRMDEESIAHNLYAVLRDYDRANVDFIFSESFSEEQFGQAIMNRLLKAAGHHVIHV